MQNKEMRITDLELSEIKKMYSENKTALKLLRKIFLPEISADAPIGQNIDLWMTMKIDELNPEEALLNIKARNALIQHVETCLMQLAILAGQPEESVEETKNRLSKNSTK